MLFSSYVSCQSTNTQYLRLEKNIVHHGRFALDPADGGPKYGIGTLSDRVSVYLILTLAAHDDGSLMLRSSYLFRGLQCLWQIPEQVSWYSSVEAEVY